MKILILKPSSLGDVVQALPCARMLRRHFPSAAIHWWIDADLASLLEGDPDVGRLVLFERRRWVSPRHWPEVFASARALRSEHYDWVIDLQALARSGLAAWLADGTLTVGLDDRREGAVAFYDVRVPRPGEWAHAVDWYLAVLEALGVPVCWDIEWLPRRAAAAESIRRRWPVEGEPWIAIQPGARWWNKRWPVGHFAALAKELAGRLPTARFVVMGGASDAEAGRAIASAVPGRSLDVTGQTSLPEMVEWIRAARLVVSNDSGPMHVAAALGRPVVALFGPTSPARTGPYGQIDTVLQERLECVPCLRSRCGRHPPVECLESLRPERVAAEVLARF
ncbi:MAG TPA: lipopolysaccharide heptosyltransferase II [Verrucomicrobiota bacterium]|nr:lipopolysaccharide heptosyltransferase II [Verrucomicrobiota bacterium]HNU50986.1 lipopolysaccharide heptosyltransferase II [Verrucomicrobiota bacterium]